MWPPGLSHLDGSAWALAPIYMMTLPWPETTKARERNVPLHCGTERAAQGRNGAALTPQRVCRNHQRPMNGSSSGTNP